MRKGTNGHGFTAIRVTGGLLPPEFLQTIAALEAPGQGGTEYGLPKNLSLKDEIARYWRIANDLYEGYVARRDQKSMSLKKTAIGDWQVPLLTTVLGFDGLISSDKVTVGDRAFPLSHTACGGILPVLLTTPDHDLENPDPLFGEDGRRRSPHGLMQELLNGKKEWLWGLVGNGRHLRLLRDNPSLTRPAFLEVDLELIFQEQLYPDFALFWLIFHATRFCPAEGKAEACILEQWRNRSHEEGQRALDHLRDGVTEALKSLGNGFLQNPKNEVLRKALAEGKLEAAEYFEEVLRLVYRFLFLFTVEERNLLHSPEADENRRRLYREGYSLAKLRERASKRRHYDRHGDLWEGLKVLFGALQLGTPALGLPALGGLFDEGHCPYLSDSEISNGALLEAVRSLAYFRSDAVLARVNYRDMGVEELGSVYESLLELAPYIDVDAAPWAFGFVGEGEHVKGSAKKLTGSYYTPAPLVNELIRSTLEPVMEEALRRNPENPREALLSLRLIDPACGSGHFLLAAARRLAIEIARLEAGSDTPDERARQHAFREVVQHCIHGVDRNPLAVELCKTALWIESVEPGKPLTFLDPHVQCGDSLVGVLDSEVLEGGIPEEAYQALTGDEKAACTALKKTNGQYLKNQTNSLFVGLDVGASVRVASPKTPLSTLPEEDIEQVEAKKRLWQESLKDPVRLREELKANLYVGAFFAEKSKANFARVPTSEDLSAALSGRDVRPAVKDSVFDLATRHRFFHWHLAFREVMAQGGFDVVLGNPPWERIKLQEQEFFATRSRWIAEAPNAAERTRRIQALKKPDAPKADKALYQAYQEALHEAEAASAFIRKGGRFPLTGVGDVNTYAVFAETFLHLVSKQGRSGFIVPTGIATDNSTRAFFDTITSKRHLVSLYDFENRDAIFPGVHRSYKFCLLTLGHDIADPIYVFFATQVDQLIDERRRFTLSPEDVERINPNTRTAPVFRSNADAELTRKIYSRVPVLIDENRGEKGNPWGISFMRLFDMSNDSGLFRTWRQLEELGAIREGTEWLDPDGTVWVPLYEAKMVHQFDHRWATYEPDGQTCRDVTEAEKKDPNYEPLPRYWVPKDEVEDRLKSKSWKHQWLMGWRRNARNNDLRTMIFSLSPRRGIGDSLFLLFPKQEDEKAFSICLLGLVNSIPFDWVARQKAAGTNMSYYVIEQLPFFPPSRYGQIEISFIMPRVLELAYTSAAMRPFAEDLGYKGTPFAWYPEKRAYIRAELDAYYARLYGLSRDELRYILDPSDIKGEDYPSESFRVLKNNEIKQFGEYRTARLVLQAWDRQEADPA
jgi:hypothetical protein